MASTQPASARESDVLEAPPARYCLRHPSRETLVSCGRCGKPYCPECLIHTPAGLRCYECAGMRRDAYQRALAGQVARALGTIVLGAAISSLIGFFAFIGGAVAGGMAGQALSSLVRRRTRGFVYALSAAVVLLGSLIGWTAAFVARAAAAGMLARFGLEAVLTAAVMAAIPSLGFWLFTIVAAVVVYQRVR
jgi:hypothetical protein